MLVRKFLRDETGSTAIEYGLIAALICLAIVSAITGSGDSLGNKWVSNANEVNSYLK